MKNYLYLIVLLFIVSCDTDNYYDTERSISLEKEAFAVGDSLIITFEVSPLEGSKTVKVYKNFKNIEFSFSLINEEKNIYNGDWTKSSSDFLEVSDIKELLITKDDPLVVVHKGRISIDGQNLYLEFPEINYNVKFKKDLFEDGKTLIRVHARCLPIKPEIGASLDEYFPVKDFKLNL